MPRYTDTMEVQPSTELEQVPAITAPAAAAGELYAMPATQGQVRFWSLDQLNPGNPALNMPLMWKFTGPLEVAALCEAFRLCVQRHETLRTTFSLVDGRLSQIIHEAPPAVEIPVLDLSAMPAEQHAAEADRLARQHAAVRMDLERGPLLELKLLRFNSDSHVLLVTMHHIICDGISNGILLRDLAEYLKGLTTAEPARLPELPIQFADFAVWQEGWLAGPEPEQSLEFWRQSLGNDFGRIGLTRDADALAAMPERLGAWTGNIETLLIPKELQDQAHVFCRKENVTLNILLFSIFAALLNRLTGQNDLTIGSPCANRTEDTSELIGLFMNIQVMRLQLEDGIAFRGLLRKVQDWTLGAYENQELPFENLVHDSFFSRGSNSFEIPIFFLYQKSFMLTHHVGALEVVPLRSESPGAVFEIMFAIVDRAEEGPRLQLEYNPRHFKVATIQRYLSIFVELLQSALAAPDRRVDQLTLLSAASLKQVTESWNQTAEDLGAFAPVVNTFLQRAADTPDAIALEAEGVVWTCARLAAHTRTLAARLLVAGMQPGALCGIAVDRSPEMLAAVLAVMLAGGVYVPLDPRHPKERLQTILADCGAQFLLVSEGVSLTTAAHTIDVAEASEEAKAEANEVIFPAPASPDDLAYVIYTSGTTGQPKGVAIEHGSLVNLLRSMAQKPGLHASDVLVAVTTLAFDIAALELLLPLLTGARLVIASDLEKQDGRLLLDLLERVHATVLQATPGIWRLLLDAGWSRDLPLRALSGAEALPRELAERMLDRAAEVWNLYGPTETTIWSAATPVEHGSGTLRIGPPIANTQFFILDAQRQPVPIGVTGQLYLGGAGLARGYWNNPALTAEKFVPNPFGSGRLYDTGDLARWHDDGTAELLGRADFQVKVRGCRIELSEIEGALLQQPGVSDCVVLQQKSDATGVTRLTAYLAAGERTAAASDALVNDVRERLQDLLPDYMLPTAFVVLPALPRNGNGKIDRKALPPLNANRESGIHSTAALDHYYPPTDSIERQLADIWQTTLGITRISVRASFFSLGVGSLAALRLITKMNRVYAMDLGLASLISASTIQSIAELIRTRFAPNTSSSVVPLQSLGTRTPLFILHGVGGNVVNFYGLAMRMGKEQPVYGIQSQALVANQPALLRLKDMAAHYIADIRKVQPHGPYSLLGYSFGGTVALEMAHQLKSAGERIALLGMIDARSKDYAEQLSRVNPVQQRVANRVNRFRGNTTALSLREQLKYVADKLSTRAIRFACMAAARMHFKQVPAFMRSAYDINYVAVQNYMPHQFDGCLVLFRASEQDGADAPHDLGWGPLFTHPVEIYDLPGDHERIFLEPNIDQLASALKSCLERSDA